MCEKAGGGRGRRAEVHNQKQEPHTMMWGKRAKKYPFLAHSNELMFMVCRLWMVMVCNKHENPSAVPN